MPRPLLKVLHVNHASSLALPSTVIARRVRYLWGFVWEGPVQRFTGIPALIQWLEATELRRLSSSWDRVWGVSRVITDPKLIKELQELILP